MNLKELCRERSSDENGYPESGSCCICGPVEYY